MTKSAFYTTAHLFVLVEFALQGRRRVFKSGPAEEISSADGTRGGEHERGTPVRLGGLGGHPREKFDLLALLCAFLMGF